MIAPEFLDTNILVYAYDDGEPVKQSVARRYLQRALEGEYVISVQVLAEFTVTLLHKFSIPLSAEKMTLLLDTLSPLKVVEPDKALVRRAAEAHTQFGINFYDGMIVAAAERAGCKKIWSEDFNAGQQYFGMRVENPFI